MPDDMIARGEPQKNPPTAEKYLLAAVMAVVWAILATLLWILLAVGFGASRGNQRLLTMLVLGAVVVVFLCAHSYHQGWKSRGNSTRYR